VGPGAIGGLFGIRLYKSGQSVLLIHHDPGVVASIRRRGVVLSEVSGKTIRAHLDVEQSLTKKHEFDLALVTVKAYDTENVARLLRKALDGRTPILSLQNGLGNIETLRQYLPQTMLLAGTTTEAALRTGPGTITHTGTGLTWIGELDGIRTKRSRMIVDVFRKAGFKTLESMRIEDVIWSKAIANSAINPISALTRLSNRELLSVSELRNAVLRLAREGIAVAKARQVLPTPPPRAMLLQILASSGRNRSSMLRDLETGRRTEIRQLNGAIASLGNRLGVSVPCSTLVSELVLGLEESQAPP
jgi:2-dehydropantoate 2-reductase